MKDVKPGTLVCYKDNPAFGWTVLLCQPPYVIIARCDDVGNTTSRLVVIDKIQAYYTQEARAGVLYRQLCKEIVGKHSDEIRVHIRHYIGLTTGEVYAVENKVKMPFLPGVMEEAPK